MRHTFKVKKISFLATASLLIALVMQLLFVTLREPQSYQSDRQETAKLDAAYYNHLIKNEIHSIEDLKQKSPNFQTTFFLGLLLAQKTIGITDETARAIFNSIILMMLFAIIMARQNLNSTTAILFQLTAAPILIYTTLPTKETFIFFGLAALIISTEATKAMSKFWLATGISIILLTRPIFGLQVIAAIITTIIFTSGGWKLKTAYFSTVVLLIILYFKEIIAVGYIYQSANLDNDMTTCDQMGISTCFKGDGGIADATVFFVRLIMWITTRFAKGFNDLATMNDTTEQNVEYFEYYINIINVIASISVLIAWSVKKKLQFGATQAAAKKINVFSKALLIIVILVAGGVAFYQTQRIYALVFGLLFIIIATDISLRRGNAPRDQDASKSV